jgi:NADH-quinone oxidoreductase subunit L
VSAVAGLVVLLPALAAAVTLLIGHRIAAAAASIGVIVTAIAFVCATVVGVGSWGGRAADVTRLGSFSAGRVEISMAVHSSALVASVLVLATGVALLVQVYSVAYLGGEPRYPSYVAFVLVFTSAMALVAVAENLFVLLVGWEVMGICSYLLIGQHWDERDAREGAMKAFLVTRFGDVGFLFGIFVLGHAAGTFDIGPILAAATTGRLDSTTTTVATLLLLCGVVGKSAQFPLHGWLPDAMPGPTPITALIHAATMVAAGVYMLCRVFFLLNDDALQVIAYIGGFTALLAALIAVQQNDIKRILAYSTLSQLGYMVMAVGLKGPPAAMYHLTTHAFFKALLFLGAGSVILGVHHEQDIWKMGALRKKMPATFWTFMAATLALVGLWPFSGFFSKDSILGQAFGQHNYVLFAVGAFAALLTSFYMFRLVIVVFYGSTKSDAAGHAHESPGVMVWPLRILAVCSIFAGGFVGVENIYFKQFPGETTEQAASFAHQLFAPFIQAPAAAFLGLGALALGFIAAYALYAKADRDPLPEKFGALSRALRNRLYFDEIYDATVIRLHNMLAAIAASIDWCIENVFIGFVRGGTDFTGRGLRLLQTGNLQTYAFLFALGVAFVLFVVLGK